MKKKKELINRVKSILCEVLNLDSIDDNATTTMYAEWDSMAYLSIISLLEDEFGICISEDNIDNFDSISNIIKAIQNKK